VSLTRVELAETVLVEAVYRSRAKQAADHALAGNSAATGGQCGLGTRAEVELELSERGREALASLAPGELDAGRLKELRAGIAEWVQAQDRLDRKRNHFLKDFRRRHGFDRRAYSSEQHSAFEAGLAAINSEVDRERHQRALRLVTLLD
jgi:hypothetical protein